MNNIYENFTKKYQVNKTLRHALIPEENTEKYIKERELLKNDFERADAYIVVKELLDNYYRCYIEKQLSDVSIEWDKLAEAIMMYRKKACEQADVKKVQSNYRDVLSKQLKSSPEFDRMFNKPMITKLLPEFYQDKNIETNKLEQINLFKKFVGYFDDYFKHRKDIFGADDKSHTIAYRVINDNFPMYVNNMSMFETMKNNYRDIYDAVLANVVENGQYDLNDKSELEVFFSSKGYNRVLTQTGIDTYNNIIGVINKEKNLYQQKNKEKIKLTFFKLYKQILSENENIAFIPEQFISDDEVFAAINSFKTYIQGNRVLERTTKLFKENKSTYEGIFITPEALSAVSNKLYGEWDYLKNIIIEGMLAGINNPTSKKTEEIENKVKKDTFSLEEIQKYIDLSESNNEEVEHIDVHIFFDNIEDIVEKIYEYDKEYEECIKIRKASLLEDKQTTSKIKQYLDSYQRLLHFYKMFNVDNILDKDFSFYEEADNIYNMLLEENVLYNKVRNYVTKKPYKTEKIKLNFETSSFLNGWGTTYDTKAAIILKKDEMYYLGVVNKKLSQEDMKALRMGVTSSNQGIRYVYEFQNVDNKNIPRLFIRSKGTRYAPSVEKYNLPIEEIIDIYDSEKFKTEYRKINETEYKQSLIKIIDYFKLGFARHESFKNYDIQWKASDEYDNINEFYKDVSNCCYRLGEETINFDVLRECEKSGKIYLFKIYNKDFSPDSTGRPNLHTLYWKSIFSRENLEDTVIRLDGNAEIFYRKASISEPVKHRKGEKVVNKWDVDNKPIPDTIYREIYDYSNNRISEISETAKAYIENNKVIIKDVKHDIVKDKRYTKNQYLLHTTISINFKQQEKIYRFNSAVCEVLKNNADVNIIGIDRGERNLIYITVINQKGEILEQKSFNNIQSAKGKVNYHAKLTQKENQRANARKNWETIENIKELKEGYLSLVIHEIAQMMISYNAIVVMEDLNKGFKGERSKVEKQVYQKFEKMLIDKLNYLTFKADKSGELKKYTDIGGVLNGYQLTDKVQSFKSIRRQCGFLFYVPANYTSKIDPMSGFVDVFRKNKKPTLDYIRKFLKLFDFIHWDSSHGFFVFEFDYDNFETVQTSYVKKWKLTSAGTRYVWNRTNGNCTYNPTEEIIRVLEENNIIYKDERNLVTDIDKMGNDIIKGIYYSFRYILQLRNERKLESYDEEELRNSDYIFSPAIVDGIQFDSRKDYGSTKYPVDSDANGAYHIALKGLICLKKISEKASADGYIVEKNFDITVAEWLKFIQNKEYIDK